MYENFFSPLPAIDTRFITHYIDISIMALFKVNLHLFKNSKNYSISNVFKKKFTF